MSMLAEPRRKQKWTLNPRGKQWSEDSNKFGQKMLEKMGWTSGKGLGANEQGMTEHVKVNYKNNQSGIGFQDRGDQWTQHQADFNDFLSQLQEQNSNSDATNEIKSTEKEESLELRSKQSKARVHYHKFTRGKDVKKYSSKDLANIFGKRDIKDACKAPKAEESVEQTIAEPTGSKDNRGGVLTIKGGNIDEYFRNKLPNFIKKGITNEGNDSEAEYEPRLGFGFDSVKDSDEFNTSDKNIEQNKSAKRKKGSDEPVSGFVFANEGLDLDYQEERKDCRKKNVDFAHENPSLSLEKTKNDPKKSTIPFSNEGFINPALNLNDLTNDDNNGAEFEVSRVEFGLDNNALDLSDENGKKKRVTFNDKVEFNTDVIKKKKKRSKEKKAKLDKFEVDNSKLKKKSKEVTSAIELAANNSEVEGFVNEALDVEAINDEVNDNELNERKTKKSKRKKNRRLSSLETIEEIAEENSQLDESEVGEAVILDETAPKKNKKLKKNQAREINLELDEVAENTETEIEIKNKDKKKGRKSIPPEESNPEEKKSDKKREKIKKKSEDIETATVLTEISKKIIKSKKLKHKVADDDAKNCENEKEAAIESIEGKTKEKKRSKGKDKSVEIESMESKDDIDTAKSGVRTKRKSNGGENGFKLTKRSKLEDEAGEENTENIEQNNRDISLSAIKKPKKSLKAFFTRAPTLYFSGSNINEIPGYGAAVTEVKE